MPDSPTATGRESWRGLRIAEGGLWYAPKRYLPGRRLRFATDALSVVGPKETQALPWDQGFPRTAVPGEWAWWVESTAAEFRQVVVVRDRMQAALPHGPLAHFGAADKWVIGLGFGVRRFSLVTPTTVVAALAEYLARTPSARDGLADETRLKILLARLAAKRVPAEPPTRRIAGNKGDLDTAIHKALDRLYPRRFAGYAVVGEAAPELTKIRAAIADSLPARLSSATADGTLDRALERALPSYLWPFDCLAP